jgi:hypothetical protein
VTTLETVMGPEGPACADDHGDDPGRPSGAGATAVGRAGGGAHIVGRTLTWALLTMVLGRRIQSAVDRRFNRRYDAARTIQAFGGRLARR